MEQTAQTCIVAGVGPGIGLAVARRFGREGFNLALLARRPDKLAAYVEALKEEGFEAAGFSVDVADEQAIKAAFAQIKRSGDSPAVLVYNAARINPGSPTTLALDELSADFIVNVAGALACVQQVIPEMKARGRGTILFTGGGLALRPNPQYASLAISKAGLRSLAYSLGEALRPDGIHVATVTVAGFVQPDTVFDPDRIAEVYWRLHVQPSERWEQEIVYRGEEA